jgi:hypothetical protein
MKTLRQTLALSVLCCALGILLGCQHKKPVLIVPKEPPPAAAPSPSPTPEDTASQPVAGQPQDQQAQPQTQTPEEQNSEKVEKDKSKSARKKSRHKHSQSASGEKAPAEVARINPPKKVIKEDKAEPTPTPGPISAGPTNSVGGQDQAATEQLLQTAEANLNGIKRQLTKEEEVNRTQVKEFISQSRKAIAENDLARAHNWAVKAQLLSDELVKQH